jgi:hypothetical protein
MADENLAPLAPLRGLLLKNIDTYAAVEVDADGEECFICRSIWKNPQNPNTTDQDEDHDDAICSPVQLACGHIIGKQCLDAWFCAANVTVLRCPYCQFELPPLRQALWMRFLLWISSTDWFNVFNQYHLHRPDPDETDYQFPPAEIETHTILRFQRGEHIFDWEVKEVIWRHNEQCAALFILIFLLIVIYSWVYPSFFSMVPWAAIKMGIRFVPFNMNLILTCSGFPQTIHCHCPPFQEMRLVAWLSFGHRASFWSEFSLFMLTLLGFTLVTILLNKEFGPMTNLLLIINWAFRCVALIFGGIGLLLRLSMNVLACALVVTALVRKLNAIAENNTTN